MMIVSDAFTVHVMNDASRSVNDDPRSIIDDSWVMLQIVASLLESLSQSWWS